MSIFATFMVPQWFGRQVYSSFTLVRLGLSGLLLEEYIAQSNETDQAT